MLTMYFSAFVSFLLFPAVFAKVQFLGVAIAGGEFGCQTDGTCSLGSVQLPLADGPLQMNHFVQDDGVNFFRLPTSWQFLVNNQLGGDLDATKFAQYDQLVQACLATGAHCMIDIHNYARWEGKIIGQGGPTDEQFAQFWSQLAERYAAEEKVVFELMNEPHDLDIVTWAQTCQAAVTAIRAAGATAQTILLPGTNFASAATLVSSGSADALLTVKNPDGSTDGLLLDMHKYLDSDNSGTHIACTTNNVAAFSVAARYLRSKGRKGFVSETSASADASCMKSFCAQNKFINANADVFEGLVGWGAGSFSTAYPLGLTPSSWDGRLVDRPLMTQCLLETWTNSTTNTPQPTQTTKSALPITSSSSSSFPVLSSTTALLTATLSVPTFSFPIFTPTRNLTATSTRDSSSSGPSTINTSNVLVLTDLFSTDSTLSTLAVATGTPPARSGSGFEGLLTAQSIPQPTSGSGSGSNPKFPVPTPTSTPGAAGSSSSGAVGGPRALLGVWMVSLGAAFLLVLL